MAWEAFKLGLAATWWGGLVIGVAALLANNPGKKGRPRLPYRRLYKLMLIPLLSAVSLAAVLGVTGAVGGQAIANAVVGTKDLPISLPDWVDPSGFYAVFGIHLGGYAGGVVGLVVAVAKIVLLRRRFVVPP